MRDLVKKIKEKLDKQNIKEHGKELEVQKKVLKEDDWIKERLKDLFKSKDEREEKRQERKDDQEATEQQQKMQEQWDQIVDEVENREQDIDQEEKLQEILDQIEETSRKDNFDTLDRLQEKLEEMEQEAETTYNTEDIKEKVKEKLKNMKDYIKEKERKYENELLKSWFSREDERLYKTYLEIEKEMWEHLDDFIKALQREIPKLKQYTLEWWYSSGRITDMNDAGKKVRLWQFWEKLYSRYEETESMEINLWICLSIDNSWSMRSNMDDTIKLVVFLWLLCQRRWIPFHVNTFGDHLNIIKDTDDDFDSRKWALMRELVANGNWTDMWVAVQKDIEVLKEVKRTHKDTVFLPIFITDWEANEWFEGQELVELIKWLWWLSMMVGIWISEGNLKQWYPDSEVIWLNNSWEIMTKLLSQLKQFFKHNKTKIFKVTSE